MYSPPNKDHLKPVWLDTCSTKTAVTPKKWEPSHAGMFMQSFSSSTCVYQDFHGWRLDWDVDGIKVCLFDVLHALHVDVKYADEVLGLDVLHGSFTRPVHVPWELGILDELSVVDPGLHHLSCDVMVVWNPKQNNDCWLNF